MGDIWDISLPIQPSMLTWPGDPPVEVHPAFAVARCDEANVSVLRLGSHTGTHIDPPSHFFDGAPTVDQIPLEILIGEATVVEIPGPAGVAGSIGPADLEAAGLGGVTRVLFKTGNSSLWGRAGLAFPPGFVSLSAAGAAWLVGHGVRLVGIDFLSVEARDAPGHPTHRSLLGAGVVIVEGLDLSAVAPGRYQLVCLPIRITGGDGGPARAVLREL
jgi:arylformamidase